MSPRFYLRFLPLALSSLLCTACDLFPGSRAIQASTPDHILLEPNRLTLYLRSDGGDEKAYPSSASFKVQGFGSNGENFAGLIGDLQWVALDESIIRLDASGRASSVGTGSTTVSVSSLRRPSLMATASVTVFDVGRADVVVR